MNNKEALKLVKNEIVKYQDALKENIFDEIIGSGVYYASSCSIAYLYSLLADENNYKALPYAVAVLISAIISLKKHNMYERSYEEKQNLKTLKYLKRKIMIGNNPFEKVETNDFEKSLTKMLNEQNS